VLIGLALSVFVHPAHATAAISDPSAYLNRAEDLRTADHPQFVELLEQIHRESPPLTPEEQWHLRYLDAWETVFEGNYAKSEPQLHDIIAHAGNAALATKASALLLTILAINHRYEEAFSLANNLAANLPSVTDPLARFLLLMNLSQMLNLAGQTDLAIQYAQMMEKSLPPGETLCRPLSQEIAALYDAKRLSSSSPELKHAVDICAAARQPVLIYNLQLIQGDIYLDEGRPDKTIALLDGIDAEIRSTKYHDHILSALVERAEAYEKLGKNKEATKAALDALAMNQPGDINEWLQDIYEVLYKVEKREGHNAEALAYYERYAAQEKSNMDDVRARALAYDMAEQHLLVQKMQADTLSRQNRILKLQQALSSKAVESSRLSITLLIVVLVSVVLWLFRLKRSQLRFKELSCLDGLTGIANHQHFISEAERALQLLQKKRGTACLVAIDLDHFKLINDTHGHAFGDAVLKRAVAICRQQLRTGDLFGRLGGEEFCILLVDCHRDQGMAIADRIRLAMEAALVDVDGGFLSFSASLGLTCTAASGYELMRLCRDADAALYRAKRAGRNRLVACGQHVDEIGEPHAEKRASSF
jgi:diguanylate cyclase (GGDEF)-like protein